MYVVRLVDFYKQKRSHITYLLLIYLIGARCKRVLFCPLRSARPHRCDYHSHGTCSSLRRARRASSGRREGRGAFPLKARLGTEVSQEMTCDDSHSLDMTQRAILRRRANLRAHLHFCCSPLPARAFASSRRQRPRAARTASRTLS